jgi:tRNA (adenine-N(1)-)-methyltransferase non-catalytic subunit
MIHFLTVAMFSREIRHDTLAQMMTMGNINSNSKVLLVDNTQGLLLGAILERTGGVCL